MNMHSEMTSQQHTPLSWALPWEPSATPQVVEAESAAGKSRRIELESVILHSHRYF